MDDDPVSWDHITEELLHFFFAHRHVGTQRGHDIDMRFVTDHLIDLLRDDTGVGVAPCIIRRNDQNFMNIGPLV